MGVDKDSLTREEMLDKSVEFYRKGRSLHTIATAIRATMEFSLMLLQEAGVDVYADAASGKYKLPKHMDPANIRRAVELRRQDYTLEHISHELSISVPMVRRMLLKEGITYDGWRVNPPDDDYARTKLKYTKKRRMEPLTDAQWQELASLRAQGINFGKCAILMKLGVTGNKLYSYARAHPEHELPNPPNNYANFKRTGMINCAFSLYAQGYTYDDIHESMPEYTAEEWKQLMSDRSSIVRLCGECTHWTPIGTEETVDELDVRLGRCAKLSRITSRCMACKCDKFVGYRYCVSIQRFLRKSNIDPKTGYYK